MVDVVEGKILEHKEPSKYKQNRVAAELYLFPKRERENIDKTHKNTKEMVVVTRSGSEVDDARGGVLAPLASVVLNETHLVNFV